MEIKRLMEEFDEAVIRSFVQKNADYYLTKWKIMASGGSKVSWNWAAFLLTGPWMGYRKMYFYAFIFLVLNLLSYIPLLGLIVWLALWIGIGMLGNYLYGKYTYNKLLELKVKFPDEEAFKMAVVKEGGTSVAGVFLVFLMALGISFVALGLIYLIVGEAYTY
ncbi:DUF2628 domain-containing protein [Persephonella sp.]